MEKIKYWFSYQSVRTQKTLIGGVAVAFMLLLYQWVWVPLTHARDSALLHGQVQQSSSHTQNFSIDAAKIFSDNHISTQVMLIKSNSTQYQLNCQAVVFDDLLRALFQVTAHYPVVIENVRLQRVQSGVVSGQVTLVTT